MLIADLHRYKMVGITGTMGSGKSTLLAKIDESSPESVKVLSLDQMVDRMYRQDSSFIRRCHETFGRAKITDSASGEIDKKVVGKLLFEDLTVAQRKRFLGYLYRKLFWDLLKKVMHAFVLKDASLVILEVPLLFESKTLLPFCFPTCTIYVEDEAILAERLRKRNDPNLESKLRKQMSWRDKVRLSDFAVKNEGSVEDAYQTFCENLLKF